MRGIDISKCRAEGSQFTECSENSQNLESRKNEEFFQAVAMYLK